MREKVKVSLFTTKATCVYSCSNVSVLCLNPIFLSYTAWRCINSSIYLDTYAVNSSFNYIGRGRDILQLTYNTNIFSNRYLDYLVKQIFVEIFYKFINSKVQLRSNPHSCLSLNFYNNNVLFLYEADICVKHKNENSKTNPEYIKFSVYFFTYFSIKIFPYSLTYSQRI